MGFNVSYETVIFCIGITSIFHIRSATSDGQNTALNYSQHSPSQQISQTPPSTIPKPKSVPAYSKYPLQNFFSISPQQDEEDPECHNLRPNFAMEELTDILSPKIFSQTDLFHYFLTKIAKILQLDIATIKFVVNQALNWKGRLPPCYIPYAKVLSSFLECWSIILNAKWYIEEIPIRRSKNVDGFSSLPLEISSSSQLSEFFSPDIFSDPQPPSRLFIKILGMPKSVFADSKIQLENFLIKWDESDSPPFPRLYIWYAGIVNNFLQNESAIDNLKRGLSEIQRISASD
ncbi:uncharacterized protein LOC135847537 [Planococcus citri]|uniref:uncharacterized protein LOC135847537 n=1 Tax=Planococcus citri TaxID=170843 RepID=UPI0031F981E1